MFFPIDNLKVTGSRLCVIYKSATTRSALHHYFSIYSLLHNHICTLQLVLNYQKDWFMNGAAALAIPALVIFGLTLFLPKYIDG